jgi:chromosome segregation ATPase
MFKFPRFPRAAAAYVTAGALAQVVLSRASAGGWMRRSSYHRVVDALDARLQALAKDVEETRREGMALSHALNGLSADFRIDGTTQRGTNYQNATHFSVLDRSVQNLRDDVEEIKRQLAERKTNSELHKHVDTLQQALITLQERLAVERAADRRHVRAVERVAHEALTESLKGVRRHVHGENPHDLQHGPQPRVPTEPMPDPSDYEGTRKYLDKVFSSVSAEWDSTRND